MARNDTDFIYVPVPRARVYEVMDLLRDDQDSHHTASPEQDPRSIASTGSEPRTAGDEAPDRWTADSLRRLIADTPPLKQRVVLQCLAENAGQPVSAAQLRTALTDSGAVTTQYSGRALGAILRGLSKRSAWYDKERPPFNNWWDHDHAENRYRMPAEYAPPVLAALAELHGQGPGGD